MEGLPSGDVQGKYQKLAAEYSKVCIVKLLFAAKMDCNLCKFIISSPVKGAREGAQEGRSRRTS